MTMVRFLRAPARAISRRSRQKKLDKLKNRITPGSTVLVVGASDGTGVGTQSLVERGLSEHARVVALTYEHVNARILGLPTVIGDGRTLPFGDGSFDYVVSNAVIEHLGGKDGAASLLRESSRVARKGWAHTTPNRRFPLELHTGVPLLHWLPTRARTQAFEVVGKPFPTSHYYLFTGRSIRRLGVDARVHRATGFSPAMTLFVTSTSFDRPRGHTDRLR